MRPIQWGIIGCGGIAHLFARGLSVLPEGTLLAGASRTPGRADEFAKKHNLDRTYSDYDALLDDPDIDAVYVATTHNFHYENVKRCLEHGKHVLCEKPFTINAAQAQELIDLAREQNCFLMEAMWTRFLPAIVKLQELLAEGAIGEVRAVRADFCIGDPGFDKEHRMRNKALAGGALLDLGVYPITFAVIVFDAEPTRIQSSALMGDTEVDDRSFYLLDYPNGRHAQLASSYTHSTAMDAFVFGTTGYIRVPRFWEARGLEIYSEGREPEILSLPYGDGENFKYEIDHAMKCIAAGKTESDVHPMSKALSIMRTMDTIRAQWGLVYPEETCV